MCVQNSLLEFWGLGEFFEGESFTYFFCIVLAAWNPVCTRPTTKLHWPFYLCLPNVGIIVTCHHAWLDWHFGSSRYYYMIYICHLLESKVHEGKQLLSTTWCAELSTVHGTWMCTLKLSSYQYLFSVTYSPKGIPLDFYSVGFYNVISVCLAPSVKYLLYKCGMDNC